MDNLLGWHVDKLGTENPVEVLDRNNEVVLRVYDWSNKQERYVKYTPHELYTLRRKRHLSNLKKAGIIIATVSRGVGIMNKGLAG